MAKKARSTKALEQNRPAKMVAARLEQHVSVQYSGPLPDPQTFAGYESITPGAGERILGMAEREQAHRHSVEKLLAEASARDTAEERREIRRSQWLAWSIAVIVICIGGVLIYSGHPITGSLLTGGTLVGIVSSFLEKRIKNERTSNPPPPPKKQ